MTTELIKMLLLDLLARVDRKDPAVSYITKPLSVLDAFRFYDCPGYLTHWIEAAIELHAERLAWAESRNGMVYLQLSCGTVEGHGDFPDGEGNSVQRRRDRTSASGYQAPPAGIRTIKQLACELAANEIQRRKI